MARTSILRRRFIAAASVAAVALGSFVAVAQAPAATAAPQSVVVSSADPLNWGFKESFRTYIKNIAVGSITVSEGAARSGTSPTAGFTWPSAGGTYDPVTRSGQLNYGGKVTFRSTGHGIWFITLANPKVVLNGSSSGKLLVDVSYRTGGTESAPDSVGSAVAVDFGAVAVSPPTVSGNSSTYTNQAVTLTAPGAEAFGGFYEAGTVLDPFTAKATVSSTPTTTPPTTPAPTNPPAANPVGALVSALLASLATLLGSLGS